MRKIIAVLYRDILNGLRDWLILYLAIAPLLIALIFRLVVPGVSDTNLNLVMKHGEDQQLVSYLDDFAKIEYVDSLEDIEERVLRMDDVFGVMTVDEKVEVITQGNERREMIDALKLLINRHCHSDVEVPINIMISDVGWGESPLKIEGANILILFTSVFGGMLILLNMVDEKMSNTLSSINVSTISRFEFVVGKSILGFILPIVGSIGALLILEFETINIAHLVITLLSIGLTSVVIGFAIGVYNDEPIAAIASMKGVFIPLILSVAGAIYLSDQLQVLLFWSPFYWAYQNINAILLNESSTYLIFRNSFNIFIISLAVFAILRKRIIRGFD